MAIVALGGAGTAIAISAADTEPPAPKYNSLARTVDPIGANGRALNLARVVIPPGSRLPLHYHQGTQVGYIQSGVLTYHVQSGRARLMRGAGDAPKLIRVIRAGQTVRVRPGQWLIEQPYDHHRAANYGRKPVVVLLANLLLKNAAPSKLIP